MSAARGTRHHAEPTIPGSEDHPTGGPPTADLFRDLLDRIDRLAPQGAARLAARRAIHSALAGPLEEAGRLALHRIAGRPLSELRPSTLLEDAAPAAASVESFERGRLSIEARGGLDRAHRLLRLDDPFLSADPRRPEARIGLIEQLHQAGRDVLGSSELRFVPGASGAAEAGTFVEPDLARRAARETGRLFYCRDLTLATGTRRRRDVRSVALAAVVASGGESLGLLEVSSREPRAFSTDDLALVALLADSFAAVLERATKIEKLVFIDPMTSAYNRSYFELEVGNEMARARRDSSSLALCIVDIDDFKSFNSRFGYEGGNHVLIHVAQSLKRAVRPFDTVARWGGEEFAVLLTAPVQAQDVATVSERLRATVQRQHVEVRDLAGLPHDVSVTVSIGVAMFPDDHGDAAELWSAANQALLEAKKPPKNRVVFYRDLAG